MVAQDCLLSLKKKTENRVCLLKSEVIIGRQQKRTEYEKELIISHMELKANREPNIFSVLM